MKKNLEKKSKYLKNTAMDEDEFRAKFSTEAKARKYYEQRIWGGKRKGWYKCYIRILMAISVVLVASAFPREGLDFSTPKSQFPSLLLQGIP